jgi:hypothetical protein
MQPAEDGDDNHLAQIECAYAGTSPCDTRPIISESSAGCHEFHVGWTSWFHESVATKNMMHMHSAWWRPMARPGHIHLASVSRSARTEPRSPLLAPPTPQASGPPTRQWTWRCPPRWCRAWRPSRSSTRATPSTGSSPGEAWLAAVMLPPCHACCMHAARLRWVASTCTEQLVWCPPAAGTTRWAAAL